jgi:hypothetical protein
MNCDEIKDLLSEYIDGVLDSETKALVDEHLSDCKNCQRELAQLKALVKELRSLESVAPPRDFLAQLHKRMEQRSWFSKTLRTLFVPLRLKIPLEFAGAAAMAILVFSILHMQQDHYRTAGAPVGLKKEGVAEKGALERLEAGLKDEASKPPRAYRTATSVQPPERKGPIDLILVVKRALPETYAPSAAIKAPPAPEEEMNKSLAMKKPVPTAQPERDKGDDDVLPQLTGLVELVGGTVVSIEYGKASNRPESVHAEIPAEQFKAFYNRLQDLGDLKRAPGSETAKGQDVLPVRIKILPFSR